LDSKGADWLENLSKDSHHSVRITTVEILVQLSKLITSDADKEIRLLPIFDRLIHDSSQIRLAIVKNYARLYKNIGQHCTDSKVFITEFAKLLPDTSSHEEARNSTSVNDEIRLAAVNQLSGFCTQLNPDNVVKYNIMTLANDEKEEIRSIVAHELVGIYKSMPKSQRHVLLPVFQKLLKDDCSSVSGHQG
jgi:hypothetical protein